MIELYVQNESIDGQDLRYVQKLLFLPGYYEEIKGSIGYN